MGYKLYEKLLDLLQDEKISKSLKRKFLRAYKKHGLLTVQESNRLYVEYVKQTLLCRKE